ncbi:MAG: hypothetical protein DRP01_02400 [Archaeoglobales archaeon]|nr:MAG: hypothetical protein DRP01_02400 [Archaeoglobales archaeon]
MQVISLLLIILGSLLYIHDLLYHLDLVPGLGKEVEIGGLRIHHGYIGALLIFIGILLYGLL